ncbi:PSP1 domain-containing protein [Flintibacter muris]|uniref:PSP1 domain-containing protein n=1 Tax=Flintibacter muris TaxID=2941327 RepID=UPI002407F42F|nr:stage 0 sporulation family protein [Flintibacter muris]
MVEIISIRFKNGGKEYYFNPNGLQFQVGDGVIVETTRGTEFAQCVRSNNMIDEIELTAPLRPVVRKATPEDARLLEKNKEREKSAFSVCQQKIAEHGLDMKLVSAEYSFDGSKILFFFTSEGRVDFRALVKDLAGALHTRIELRQIGVRDEAKMLGGLGICGKPFCCSQFLDEFQPVSIKMAKTQNLSLNPTKISGTCGRLMCCLKYEQEAYEDLVKRAPKQDSFVETPDGAGTVSSINLLRQTAQVRLESDPESPKTYHNCELCVIRSGKGKRPEGYVEPPLEELAKLRRQDEDAPAPVTEEASLAAAIEAAFPSREREEPVSHGDRPNRRGRGRRPKGEGGEQHREEQRQPPEGAAEQRPDSPPSNRRRRRRPKGGGGKPSSPQQ